MAKISARGDKKVKEWKRDDGAVMVLTEQGRLLRRFKESSYNVVGRKVTRERAAVMATDLGYKET